MRLDTGPNPSITNVALPAGQYLRGFLNIAQGRAGLYIVQGAGIYRTNQNGFTQVHKLGNNIIYIIAVSAESDGDKIAVAAKDQNVKHWIIELNENGGGCAALRFQKKCTVWAMPIIKKQGRIKTALLQREKIVIRGAAKLRPWQKVRKSFNLGKLPFFDGIDYDISQIWIKPKFAMKGSIKNGKYWIYSKK